MAKKEIPSIINVQGLGNVHLNNYRLPEVIAELVDNSLDSFESREGAEQLVVDIRFSENEIVYMDNASGFSSEDFNSAFITHHKNNVGVAYGTYGIGMKHALLWLGKSTIIETRSIKDKQNHRTEYPLIKNGLYQENLILEENCEAFDFPKEFSSRFTIKEPRIERIQPDALTDLRESLGEIYKLQHKTLLIRINNDPVNFTYGYEILNAIAVENYREIGGKNKFCLKNPTATPVKWKVSWDDKTLVTLPGKEPKSITGYLAIKNDTKLPNTGLRIFRNGRCVLGFSKTFRYIPYGQSNTFQAKYLVGEIHLHGFKKVTIGAGLPEASELKKLLEKLKKLMQLNPEAFESDNIVSKFWKQANEYRITTHPNALQCPKNTGGTRGPGGTGGRGTGGTGGRGTGGTGGRGTGGTGGIQNPKFHYEHKILDQKYARIKRESIGE